VLQEHVRKRLPDYMVPGAIMVLASWPLTPNGKVDRKSLPAPVHNVVTVGMEARTATEELLCGIWSEVLHLEKIGIHQNFFNSGGHSLLATQAMARMRTVFERDLPLHLIFQYPTIAGLARAVEFALREEVAVVAAPLVKRPRRVAEPLSFAQE